MDNQHEKIKGYRNLTQKEIDTLLGAVQYGAGNDSVGGDHRHFINGVDDAMPQVTTQRILLLGGQIVHADAHLRQKPVE